MSHVTTPAQTVHPDERPPDGILIPVDGSPVSEQAARVGFNLARGLGARVVLIHALKGRARTDADQQVGQALLERLADLARHERLAVTTRLELGLNAGEAIVRVAEAEGIDLIVMGTHGRGGLEKMLLGSVAEHVVRHAVMPVALVHGTGRVTSVRRFEHVLVPVDGSPISQRALDLAGRLAGALRANLRLLHVIPDLPAPTETPALTAPISADDPLLLELQQVQREAVRAGQAILTAALERLPDRPVESQWYGAGGEPIGAVIAQVADQIKADLIVMGTHGRGGFNRLLMGSVAEGVTRHATVPVVLVRDPEASKI
jgi:nucleotide-binding universal stress UspA family protein